MLCVVTVFAGLELTQFCYQDSYENLQTFSPPSCFPDAKINFYLAKRYYSSHYKLALLPGLTEHALCGQGD